MVSISRKVKSMDLAWDLNLVANWDRMVVCHIEEFKLLVKTASNDSVSRCIIPDSWRRLLEREKAGSLLKSTLLCNFDDRERVSVSYDKLPLISATKIFDWVRHFKGTEGFYCVSQVPNFDSAVRGRAQNSLLIQVANSLDVVRMSSCNAQVCLSVWVLDVPQLDSSLVCARNKMPIVCRKDQVIDTIGVFRVSAQCKFIF